MGHGRRIINVFLHRDGSVTHGRRKQAKSFLDGTRPGPFIAQARLPRFQEEVAYIHQHAAPGKNLLQLERYLFIFHRIKSPRLDPGTRKSRHHVLDKVGARTFFRIDHLPRHALVLGFGGHRSQRIVQRVPLRRI